MINTLRLCISIGCLIVLSLAVNVYAEYQIWVLEWAPNIKVEILQDDGSWKMAPAPKLPEDGVLAKQLPTNLYQIELNDKTIRFGLRAVKKSTMAAKECEQSSSTPNKGRIAGPRGIGDLCP